MATPKTYMTLKALIAFIFCLIGLQYLSLLQVNEKLPVHGRLQSLFQLAALRDRTLGLLSNTSQLVEPASSIPSTTAAATTDAGGTKNTTRLCPMIPPGLHGPFQVTVANIPSMAELGRRFESRLELGGHYRPSVCRARHRVAIIVPYRDRDDHLRTFLLNMHTLLPKQQIDYTIFVVEQRGKAPFNRAMLMNVGAAEAMKLYDFQCFIFHDVDLLPEDDRNLYNCPVQPRHMSVAIDSFKYRLPYDDIFGGVSAMTVGQFRKANGFSNLFWGWGGEDDDMSNRLRQKKLYISRYPANIARYKMLKHAKVKANPDRFKILHTGIKRMDKDGFNALKYKRVDMRLNRLYTWLLVDLPHLTV